MKAFTKKLISAILASSMALSVMPAIALAEGTEVKTVDLVLFMGQSNMAGRGTASEAPTVTDGAGYEYRAVSEPHGLYPLTEPFGENENNDAINDYSGSGENRRSGDMVASLVNAYYDKTQVPIVGVQCSQGGKSVSYFLNTTQFNEAVSRYSAAADYLTENGYTIRRKFLVWCQGESDGDNIYKGKQTIDKYKTSTANLFNKLESEADIEKEFIVQTGHYNYNYGSSARTDEAYAQDTAYLRIAQAQAEMAADDADAELVASFYSDEALADMQDQYHYHQDTYNSVGETAGTNIAAFYDDTVTKADLPTLPELPNDEPKDNTDPEPDDSDFTETEVTFNFNDSTATTDPKFVTVAKYKTVWSYDQKDDAEDKYIIGNAESASKTNTVASYMDLTDYTAGASKVDISFDMHLPYLSKSCIGLVDKKVRGDEYGGSSGDTYEALGDIFTIIGEKDGRLYINEASNGTSIGGKLADSANQTTKWAHYDVSIDFETKKLSYSVSAIDGTVVYKSVQNTAFRDTESDCTSFDGIEVYSWQKGEQLSLDNLYIKAKIPAEPVATAKITGNSYVAKVKGETVTSAYSIEKNYEDDNDVFSWSVSGVDGVTIDADTGVLSAASVAGNGTATVKATVVSSSKLTEGAEFTYSVSISDLAVAKTFEITSSDTSINISELETYGTDTLRIYKADGSYETITKSGDAVANTTGGTVTIVPEYKFEFTNQESPTNPLIAEYVKVARDSYKDGKGYGLLGSDYKIDANGCLPKAANPIKIDLPDGFYDMTIYRQGGGHADVYSNNHLIVQNSSAAASQNRAGTPALLYAPGMKIEGGNANIYTQDERNSEKIASIKITRVPEGMRKPVIWIAGDSESADYYPYSDSDLDSEYIMRTGIGTQLRRLLDDKTYSIANFAEQSYTAEKWVNECLEPLRYFIQKGDTVIINLGMNKENENTAKENITKIIQTAKDAGAKTVLVSPIYSEGRKPVPVFGYDAATQTNSILAFAKAQGVPCIDLNKCTQEYISKAAADTDDADWILHNYHVDDNLHLTQHGALLAADFIAAGMKKLGYETTDFSYEYTDISDIAADTDGNKIRGTETEYKRTYSIAEVSDMVNPYIPEEQPVVTPGELLYSENFESYAVGSSSADGKKAAKWETSYGPVEVYADTDNKYLRKASDGGSSSRSAYVELPNIINKDFVFEADLKFESNNNVSSFEIVENKDSIYTNHGVYSNAQYAFKVARPKGSNVYVVNNTRSDSNLAETAYNQPIFKTKDIGSNWVHIKVIGNFDKKTTIAHITSLDGNTEYYHGVTDMSEGMTGFKCLMLMSASDSAYSCIDNIEIREATEYDLSPQYHKVKITDFGNSFEQYVLDGESVVNIPSDVETAYGANFEGWQVDGKLYTSAQLASLPITKDCEIVSKVKDSYIEPLESVEFSGFPAGNELTMGPDGDTFADNIISLKITGARGTSLVLNPNEKVNDYKIDWKFDGFRTLDGKTTGETGNNYCDSYGLAEVTETVQPSVNFKLKNTAANYYGKVTAKVTYNGKTISVSNPLVVLGDKSGNTILPRRGYISDFSKYEDTMADTDIQNYTASFDGWNISSGYKSSRYASLVKENGSKFLRVITDTGNAYLSNEIGQVSGQTLFEQDVRFNTSGADIYYSDAGKDVNNQEAFILNFDGSKIKLNGNDVANAVRDTWYHIAISVSPDTKKVSCKVYNESGETLLGTADAEYKESVTTQSYYVVKPAAAESKTDTSSVDINNVTVTDTGIKSDTFTITAAETAQIPTSGSTTLNLSAAAQTTSGFDATDNAEWSIDGLADGVTIVADANNSHNAVLTITSEAASGYLPVRCTIDGVSVVKTIKLTGDKDNVAFTNAPMGVMIPLSGETKAEYTAVVRDGQAEEISGKTVSYSLESAPTGVSIDAASGVLTVASTAAPGTVTVIASSTDQNNDAISRSITVKLYNLKFSLGADKAGYTTVNADDKYSDTIGFGITGTAVKDGSALSGTGFGFNVKLERGKVYRITAKYTGELEYEKKDEYMTGIIPTDAKLGKGQPYMDIALFGNDILDMTLTGAGKIETIEITPVEKTKQALPDWWTVGDSTVSQSGSWGSTLLETEAGTRDIDKYTDFLGVVINDFHNSGSAGRHHMSFYNAGWFNYILVNMNPGDIVSISGMGTNNSTSTKEMFKQFNNFYIDAVEDMGGKVILGSYTPTGNYGETAGKVYDSDNMVFKGRRDAYPYEQAIREVYEARKDEEQILGFIDIGKIVDDKMTADVQGVYKAAVADGKSKQEAREVANARATGLMGLWKDFNHYYNTTSRYFQKELISGIKAIITGVEEPEEPDNKEKVEIIIGSDSSVSVKRNDKTVDNAELLHAVYVGGVLSELKSYPLDFSNGDTVTVSNVTASSGDKLFVWSSLDKMEPLCAGKPIE